MVTDMTSTTVTVQWGPVPCIHQNGAITGYSVIYGEVGKESPQQTVIVSERKSTFSNLMPSTKYWISIAAVNRAGTGVYSNLSETTIAG